MSTYDPQRNRPRARPKEDEPAPVDALLGETATVPEATVPEAVEATHVHEPHGDHDHHHHDHDHHHDHGGGVGRALFAVASVVGLVALVRWARRRRR
jgi:hypothetical protein